jgi:hypothetical protein
MPLALDLAEGGQRVGRLARLRDREEQRALVERANSSIRYSPTSAACQLVPQPVSTMRLIRWSCRGVRFRPPKTAVASSRERRPRMVARIVSGCS